MRQQGGAQIWDNQCRNADEVGAAIREWQVWKVIRVEKAGEVDEASRLRKELRRVKEALADAHVELALEKAYLEVACEQLDQTTEGFKKKQAGGRRTGRSRPTGS